MFFTRGNPESVRIIISTLNQFGDISGHQINHTKSRIFAAGVTVEEFSVLKDVSNFTQGDFPVRYLGVPLMHGKLKSSHFTPLIDSISGRIRDWTSSSLSYAGRLELISSVIQGIEAFWLHAFPLPSMIIDRINKLCRSFLWAGGRAKVAWADICKPKIEGGLGLRNCKNWNIAMLFKVLWDLHNAKQVLWIKWVHVYYLKKRSIWDWTCEKADPPIFKKLEKIRNVLLDRTGSVNAAVMLLRS